MNRDEMLDFAKEWMRACLLLAKGKNQDYAQTDDPFFNLRRGGLHGIAVRLDDKVSRLINLSDGRSAAVATESVEDTLKDICNYAWLAAAFIADMKGHQTVVPPHSAEEDRLRWVDEVIQEVKEDINNDPWMKAMEQQGKK